MGNWTFGLAGLACLAMMALVCLPMAAGGIRGWWDRRGTAPVPPPADSAAGEHDAAPPTHLSTPDSPRVR